MLARDMVPGKSYRGTGDGPERVDGVCFTVLATVTFMPEGGTPYDAEMGDGDIPLMQVVLDAWAWPFPEVIVFSPGDWVEEMTDDDYGILPGAVFQFGWERVNRDV